MTATHKSTQYWLVALKVLVVVLAFGYLYHTVSVEGTTLLPTIKDSFKNNHILCTLCFLALASINWLLEITKWRTVVRVSYPITFSEAAKQSLGSLTASLITPNRIGEYGAKALYFNKDKRKKIVFLNFIHNSAQLITTLVFGIPAFAYFLWKYSIAIAYERIIICSIVVVVLLVLGYFFRKKQLLIKGMSLANIWHHVATISLQKKINILGLSVARYVVFSSLFYIILRFFGATGSFLELAPIIFSMYLLVSVVPSFFILDVVIRGGVSLWLFSFAEIPEMTVLATVFLMWLLNVVLPALLGGYHVLTFKGQKS